MTLEDLTKPNFFMLLGLGVVSIVLPKILPDMRPGLRSAIKFGIELFAESEGEAEVELIDSLVSATVHKIERELTSPASKQERTAAVKKHVRDFKHQAGKVSSRWGGGEAGRRSFYLRHIEHLDSHLNKEREDRQQNEKDILDEALATLREQSA